MKGLDWRCEINLMNCDIVLLGYYVTFQPLLADLECVMPGYSTFRIVTYSRRAAEATHLVALCLEFVRGYLVHAA